MATATWIKTLLDEQGVSYEERRHPEAFTAQQVAQREHVSGHRLAKVVALMADGQPVEAVLPASRRVELGRLATILGAREVRLASEDEIEEHFHGCEVGAIPALRHWPGMEVLMDAAMHRPGEIVFQAGTHRDAIAMQFDDWFRMVRPRVDTFTVPEAAG